MTPMNTATQTLLAFWEDPRNIPFKGQLISEESPSDGQEPTTCMCAQGQALYIVGGYSPENLRNLDQNVADQEVAKLLGISVSHSVLLRGINDSSEGAPSDVLTNPEKYLGPNYLSVLNFWLWLDTLSEDQWEEVERRYSSIPYAALDAARDAARGAAWDAALNAARGAAGDAAWYTAGWATVEIMGSIENPVFRPLFDKL